MPADQPAPPPPPDPPRPSPVPPRTGHRTSTDSNPTQK